MGASAICFGSNADYVYTKTGFSLTKNGNYSLSFWLNPKQYDSPIFNKKKTINQIAATLLPTGEVSTTIWGKETGGTEANIVLKSTVIPKDIWTHVVITVDSKTKNALLYINEILQDTKPFTFSPNSANDVGEIGSTQAGLYFKGCMDDVRVYKNKAMSLADIQNLYRRTELKETVPTPIRIENYGQTAYQQFDYEPNFVPTTEISFDSKNRPYARLGNTVQTLDANKKWVRFDFTTAIKQAFPTWDGVWLNNPQIEQRLVFDAQDWAYMFINTNGRTTTTPLKSTDLVVYSTDLCRTWKVLNLGTGITYPTWEMGGVNTPLSNPPCLLGSKGFSALNDDPANELYIHFFKKNGLTLELEKRLLVAPRAGQMWLIRAVANRLFRLAIWYTFVIAALCKHRMATSVPLSISTGFIDAADFGFSPQATGIENTKALQRAVDQTGTVIVSKTGTYNVAGTVYIGSNTSLIFGNNIYLKKVDEQGQFSHVIVNKGAATKTYNENITVEGLQIIVNGMDVRLFKEAYGLHGQLAFFYIKNLKIDRFRCLDLGKAQYGIHVCTFEDIIINDVVIKGMKDGVHLGRGKRFRISNGVFQTFDDAIALNAHDYAVGNPELGWIEDGLVEKCHDLNQEKTTGYFCRILAGAWIDWKAGMEVQQSDAVVSNGKIYRVQAKPDGKVYKSMTQPTHLSGSQMLDSINWGVIQNDVTYTAGVRNVTFRDIFLEKPRLAFSIHFDNDKYSRSYYPNAEIPKQEQLVFDNIRLLHNQPFISTRTPIDVITITNSSFKNNAIEFLPTKDLTTYLTSKINIFGCVFNQKGTMTLIENKVEGKKIILKTASNLEYHDDFTAKINQGKGTVIVDSDLTGLKKQ